MVHYSRWLYRANGLSEALDKKCNTYCLTYSNSQLRERPRSCESTTSALTARLRDAPCDGQSALERRVYFLQTKPSLLNQLDSEQYFNKVILKSHYGADASCTRAFRLTAQQVWIEVVWPELVVIELISPPPLSVGVYLLADLWYLNNVICYLLVQSWAVKKTCVLSV